MKGPNAVGPAQTARKPSARTARWAMGGESQAPRSVLSDGGSFPSFPSSTPPLSQVTTSRRALGCSDARRAGRTAVRSLSVGTFPTLRPFGHQQPREDAASVRRGAVTSDRNVRPPPLAACWRVPLPTCHDSASRRRWWPRGFARTHPGCDTSLPTAAAMASRNRRFFASFCRRARRKPDATTAPP